VLLDLSEFDAFDEGEYGSGRAMVLHVARNFPQRL